MEKLQSVLESIDNVVWGPATLVLLVGTGIFLTIRLKFLPWKNLFPSLITIFSPESRKVEEGKGDISPFSALMTALAGTIGTGNIVGVATAMVLGGPGALVWMWVAAAFGITTKYAECALAIKYREKNENGEMCGGPMYTIKNAFKNKGFAKVLSAFFAIFTVMASFGVGNLSQANSISDSVSKTFSVPTWVTGIVLAIFTFVIVFGGIKSISKVTSVLVPVMAVFYIVSGIVVIIANIKNVPSGVAAIFSMAFGGKAVAGGVMGAMTASMMNSMKFGFARGVFSNEAGLGSAAISASSVATDNHVKQGYINMCGTLIDTFFVCTITGLVIASSGLLGTKDESGEYITGAKLTLSAFESILGKPGIIVVTIGIILFAWSTILGWEYQGEKALEFLFKKPAVCHFYRVFFAVMVYFGATLSLDIVWSFSDIANGLMAIPNLISLLILSGILAKDTLDYEKKKRNNLL